MRETLAWTVVMMLCGTGVPASQVLAQGQTEGLRLRPATLAQNIDELAGQQVELSGARAVGMFGPRVLVIDTAGRLPAVRTHRDRILVLVPHGDIHVRPELLVGATVRVSGVARTLLGVQLTREVPWPAELDQARLDRLDIRAAVLATSLQTAEGVELTTKSFGERGGS